MISSSGKKRDSLLFVYGTLRPCACTAAARWLASKARYLGPARTRGRLFDLGRYPGLLPPRSARDWVEGDLYVLRSVGMLRELDRYEGVLQRTPVGFDRVRSIVAVPRGSGGPRFVVAWQYVYRGPVRRCAHIRSGDYRDRLR